MFKRFILKLYGKAFVEQWNIAIIPRPIHSFLKAGLSNDIKIIFKPCRNKYQADPFGITLGNINYIFYEAFDYYLGQGVINCIECHQEKIRKVYHNILRIEGHASYPFLLEHEGKIFCLPENAISNKLTLYEASIFPTEWIPAKDILMDFQAIDPTIVAFNQRLWLFCTKGGENVNDELYVFYSDNILGPWQPHKKNPVKHDIKSSRPAGSPLIYKEKLYRPAQDCSKEYGGRIIINKIKRLSPTEFMEEEFYIINPPDKFKNYCGIHTISRMDNFTLVDLKSRVFSPRAVKNLIKRNLIKLIQLIIKG
jgi:hypothetical protein